MNNKSIFTSPSFLFLIMLSSLPYIFFPSLVFNNSPLAYLPEDLPSVILVNELEKIFPGDQNAFIMFQGDALYSNDFLDNLELATRKINRHPLVERVINVTEMEHIQGNNEGFDVLPLLGKKRRKEIETDLERYQYAIKDRFAYRLTVGDESDFMAIVVRPVTLESTAQRIEIMNAVMESLDEYHLSASVSGMAGPVVVEIEQFYSMVNDTLVFMPATMIIGLTLLWFMYRRMLAVVVAGLVTGAVTNISLLLYVIFITEAIK